MATLEAYVCLPEVLDFGPFSSTLLFFLLPFWSSPITDPRRISGCKVLTLLHCLRMIKHLSLRSSTERPAGWAESVLEEDTSEPEPEPVFPR